MTIVVAARHQRENLDKIEIQISSGRFAQIGDVAYIHVHYAEHHFGDYGDDIVETEYKTKEEAKAAKCHYMVGMGAYFPLNRMEEAMVYFNELKNHYDYIDANPEPGHVLPSIHQVGFSAMKRRLHKLGYPLEEVKQMNEEFFGVPYGKSE